MDLVGSDGWKHRGDRPVLCDPWRRLMASEDAMVLRICDDEMLAVEKSLGRTMERPGFVPRLEEDACRVTIEPNIRIETMDGIDGRFCDEELRAVRGKTHQIIETELDCRRCILRQDKTRRTRSIVDYDTAVR